MYKKKVSFIFINLNKVLAFNTFFIERRYERARKALGLNPVSIERWPFLA